VPLLILDASGMQTTIGVIRKNAVNRWATCPFNKRFRALERPEDFIDVPTADPYLPEDLCSATREAHRICLS
jgi:hypothetical protein